MSVFTLIFLVLFLGDFVWCWNVYLRLRRVPQPWRTMGRVSTALFTAVQVPGLLLLFFGRQWGLPFEAFVPQALVAGIYIWHCLVLLPLVLLWLLERMARGILWIARALAGSERDKPGPPAWNGDAQAISRRDFVAAVAWTAPVVLTLGTTGVAAWQWNQFRVRRLTVPIPHLPAPLDGLTIAQVCDLHVGVFTRGAILDEIVEATNQLHADLVMLPGDLINYSLSDLPAAIDVAKRLEAKYGVFVCEGNHDLFEDPAAFRARTVAAGLRLLVNETALVPIRGTMVQVLGLRWGSGKTDPRAMSNRRDPAIAASVKELLAQRQPDAFPILLAHHPHAFDYAGDIPLTLSGHTHGGQIMLTEEIGFGPAMFRYWTGLYQKEGRSLVVSNGVGNWFPLRVQAPAEIVHLTLRSA